MNIPPVNLTEIAKARHDFLQRVRAEMAAGLEKAADTLLADQKVKASLTDHTLAQLAQDGHPYAWSNAPNDPHDDWLVHNQQSGKGMSLLEGLSRRPLVARKGGLEIELHSAARHTWYVLLGTRWMRPRDFVSASLIDMGRTCYGILASAHARAHDNYHFDRDKAAEIEVLEHPQFPAQLPNGGKVP